MSVTPLRTSRRRSNSEGATPATSEPLDLRATWRSSVGCLIWCLTGSRFDHQQCPDQTKTLPDLPNELLRVVASFAMPVVASSLTLGPLCGPAHAFLSGRSRERASCKLGPSVAVLEGPVEPGQQMFARVEFGGSQSFGIGAVEAEGLSERDSGWQWYSSTCGWHGGGSCSSLEGLGGTEGGGRLEVLLDLSEGRRKLLMRAEGSRTVHVKEAPGGPQDSVVLAATLWAGGYVVVG